MNCNLVPQRDSDSYTEYGNASLNYSIAAYRKGNTVTITFFNTTAQLLKAVTFDEQYRPPQTMDFSAGNAGGYPIVARMTTGGIISDLWQFNNGSVSNVPNTGVAVNGTITFCA